MTGTTTTATTTMAMTMTTAKRGGADRFTALGLSAGLGLLWISIACAPEAPDAEGPNEPIKAAQGPLDNTEAAAGSAKQGRLFTDVTTPVDTAPTAAELAAATKPPKFDAPGGGNSAALQEFAKSVDPSMLTPEALAKNPLVMGVKKREPFVLPEGADPHDPSVYGWDKDDEGHWIISYSDLSLESMDKDELLDALIYPDEYEEGEIQFPDRIQALDGEKVALTGYMIPMIWEDSKVKNFMLVRDLMACCFGGSPEPDEWVDCTMQNEGCSYIQFIPVTTQGTFYIQGISDAAGYATGAFRMDATSAVKE